ncbi:MAG: CRISPR-associated helicase Cas3' [Lachnospiraceae bacterium]|nr:CRISPR-associated helicase Cas3' [Lachnospiraceae bacterium]
MEIRDYLAKPDRTIGQHSDELLEQAGILWRLGYIKDEHMYYLLQEACLHHDDGKANPQFARRVLDKRIKFDPDKEIAHNILSVFYLNPDDYSDEDYVRIACAILYHHDYCDEAEVINSQKELIDRLLIKEYCYKLKRKHQNKIWGPVLYEPKTIILKGLLHRCDYSASGNYQVEYPNDFLTESMDRLMKSWQQANPELDWNVLQRFCMDNREENIIAVAPTGMGKTEAGLLWMGDTKGFFILPVRTAINAIYDRVKNNILHNEKIEHRLALLHSESLQYFNEHAQELDILEYQDRGRGLSLPLNISTLDQLFDFVLKYKGYEMKLAILAYSKVVIDEIQMYGPDLLAYLVCGLRQINRLGGKIAIVTATLSPFLRDILREDAGIPFVEKRFSSDAVRHSVCVKNITMAAEDIVTRYRENREAERGNKILVVCNTVRKAQRMYDELSELLGQEEKQFLHIFHSRFIQKDRKRLEQEIREFGKTYVENEKEKIIDIQNGIWISTSLVEVSLDIDFDYLFTELSELNALFQRMGRCNRKGVKQLDGYNCYVYCDGAAVKQGRSGYIDQTFYQCSYDALQSVDGPLSEQEKTALLDQYFTMERLKNSAFMQEYREIYGEFIKLEIGRFKKGEQLRNILTDSIIPKTVYDENMALIQKLEEELAKIEQNIKESKVTGDHQKILKNLLRQRLEIQEKLKDFTVSIPRYEHQNYIKKIWEDFGVVEISKYERIPVMDCNYDEKGYYPLNYNDRSVQNEIMML